MSLFCELDHYMISLYNSPESGVPLLFFARSKAFITSVTLQIKQIVLLPNSLLFALCFV